MRKLRLLLRETDYKSALVLFIESFFIFLVCIGLGNVAFINDSAKYAHSLMSHMDNNVTLKMSDAKKTNSILWKYDWYAGYDIAYHYAAKETKVSFSSPMDEWTCSIDGAEIDPINSFISTSSRVHEYKHLYFGDYLSLKLLGGTPWDEYKGNNDVYISQNTFEDYCDSHPGMTIDAFLSSSPALALDNGSESFTYHIVGVIEQKSADVYGNVYGNFVFGSTKALTYNKFKEHYLDITCFAYDVQGWEMEFSYLFGRLGAPNSGNCNYEYSNSYEDVRVLQATERGLITSYCLLGVGIFGAALTALVAYKLRLRCKVRYGICLACVSTFVLFAIAMIASDHLYAMLGVIADNHSIFFAFVLLVGAIFFAMSYVGLSRWKTRGLDVLKAKIG